MKTFGDFADLLVDKFRNTMAADVSMFILSVIQAIFRR